MKVGLSTYSLSRAIKSGAMDVLGAIEWIAKNGGEHVELSLGGSVLMDDKGLIKSIVKKAKGAGLEISSYTIGANFIQPDAEKLKAEIERVKKEVDIGGELGVRRMRHDAASRPIPECGIAQFMKDLPVVADACREVADHAKRHGITTSVENHGYFMQKSDRVQALIHAVGRDNFKTTLDVGNFMCAEEDSVAAAKNNMPYASHVHFKDFYFRPFHSDPGEGWFKTLSGNYLRGAIVGQGDVDIRSVVKVIKSFGYDGNISIEFEGMEDCEAGSRIGMANLRRLWDECL